MKAFIAYFSWSNNTKKIVEEKLESVEINSENLSDYLGAKIYRFDLLDEENQIDVIK